MQYENEQIEIYMGSPGWCIFSIETMRDELHFSQINDGSQRWYQPIERRMWYNDHDRWQDMWYPTPHQVIVQLRMLVPRTENRRCSAMILSFTLSKNPLKFIQIVDGTECLCRIQIEKTRRTAVGTLIDQVESTSLFTIFEYEHRDCRFSFF